MGNFFKTLPSNGTQFCYLFYLLSAYLQCFSSPANRDAGMFSSLLLGESARWNHRPPKKKSTTNKKGPAGLHRAHRPAQLLCRGEVLHPPLEDLFKFAQDGFWQNLSFERSKSVFSLQLRKFPTRVSVWVSPVPRWVNNQHEKKTPPQLFF